MSQGPGQADKAVDLPTRRALGQALRHRAHEVAETVVGTWAQRRAPSDTPYGLAASVIARDCHLGAELIGRYLDCGEGATSEEAERLADSARMSVGHQFPWTDITQNSLTWRDTTIRMVLEEGRRLGADADIIAEATGLVGSMADGGLVRMAENFDAERRELQARLDAERAHLHHLAVHDPLTGLPNRTLLLDRLTHALAMTDRRQRPVTVLFLDLDDFKAINDDYGHSEGDNLLVAMASCLTKLVRPSDTVARLGGDEFVILCEDLDGGQAEIDALTARIQTEVSACLTPQRHRAVSVSVGAAIGRSGADPEHVLTQADFAMYAAKHGAGRVASG
jgi:diguanylate cyclase (GGDEF)-like protein